MPSDKRERQRQNREAKRQAELAAQRKATNRRRITIVGVLLGLAALIILAGQLTGGDEPATTTTAAADTTSASETTASSETTDAATDTTAASISDANEAFRAQPTACGAEAPALPAQESFDAPEDQGIATDATVTATMATSCGEVVLTLDPAEAPETVNSFVFLARQGYYDGIAFHRIAPQFVVQGGDPTGTGGGDPGYVVPDELPDDGFVYEEGTLAMANAGPGTTGSQFFIVTGPNAAGLPPAYSVFGRVSGGQEALDAIAAVPVAPGPTGENSAPQESVYIERVEIDIS